jgi:hypothetical protein
VGVFCEELMACAALVQVGPARQGFWAVFARDEGRLRERTRLLPPWRRRTEEGHGAIELVPGRARTEGGHAPPESEHLRVRKGKLGRLRVNDGGVLLDLLLLEDAGIEALCPHGRQEVWTRKQAGIPARGTLSLDGGPPREIEALAVIDDTAGYHARRTEWQWSAGVGDGPDGVALAWNLVSGVNDPPAGSERAVWVAGEPHEAPPVTFAPDLSKITCEDSSELRFDAETERTRSDNFVIFKSDYRAPFGAFTGILPGGIALARGLGVMEHHRARW